MSHQAAREVAVQQGLGRIKQIAAEGPVDRPRLQRILSELLALAADGAFWSEAEFPQPEAGERQARYLISEDADRSFALYLNVMKPGKKTPPHDHTTWATIAAVEGIEFNHLYERVEGGFAPGPARLRHSGTLEVGPGKGVALLPDDVHAVEIRGETPIRHLHLYGRALETLSERLAFDLDKQQCDIMSIGVATRR